MKSLILYFSHSGNTRKIAQTIQKFTDAEIAEIKPLSPYPTDYDACVKQAETEAKEKLQREIEPLSINLDDYDTIYIGTPVWWYTFAPPLRTILNGTNWEGKTIYPFASHGGGLGSTFRDFQSFCKGADVKEGLDIYFNGSSPSKSENEIKTWINQ